MSIFDALSKSSGRLKSARLRYFAHRIVYPEELPAIMRKHIYTGVMGSIWANVIAGQFFGFYATRIGMSKAQMSLMGGVVSLMIATQLLGGFIAQRLGRRKLIWFTFCIANRLMRILAILCSMALWYYHSPLAVPVLILGICIASFFNAQEAPPWWSWFADIIPEHIHGRFWGRRTVWIAFWNILIFIPAGLLIDHVPDGWKIPTVVALFVIATAIGVADVIIHGTIPEPRAPRRPQGEFVKDALVPLRDRAFRPWLNFSAAWTFSATLADTAIFIYIMDDLRLQNNMLGSAILIAIWMVATFAAAWPAGVLTDRLGPKRVLIWGHLVLATQPFFWFLATPSTAMLFLGIASVVGSVSSVAAVTAANKYVTRFPPHQHRAMYVGVSSSVGSLAGALGAVAGAVVLWLFGSWGIPFAGKSFDGLHVLFIASVLLRLASAFFILRTIPEPQPHPPAPRT